MLARSSLACTAPLLLVIAAAAACTKTGESARDTTAAVATTPAETGMPAMKDTSMSGMPGMNSTPAKDADQEFLRMMVDHHQGLIAMADSARIKSASAHIRNDAKTMQTKQAAEQKKIQAMLRSDYNDEKMPMIMPSNASMLAAASGKTGADYDRQFRENVIAHHEEALKMIDDFNPRFTRPAVKQMAAKMRADQSREIAELKKELQSK